MTTDYAGRRRNTQWRELVALTLQLSSLDATHAPQRTTAEGDDQDESNLFTPDVYLSGWHIKASAAADASRLGPALDEATEAALTAGDGHIPVVIQHRRAQPADGALVVMSLATFRAVAANLTGVES